MIVKVSWAEYVDAEFEITDLETEAEIQQFFEENLGNENVIACISHKYNYFERAIDPIEIVKEP